MLTPLGVGETELLAALRNGVCVAPPAGRVPEFDPTRWIPNKKTIKLLNRQAILGCASVGAAMASASVGPGTAMSDDAIFLGSGFWAGSVLSMRDAILPSLKPDGCVDYGHFCDGGYRNLPPLWILPLLPNTTAGQATIMHGIKGLNLSIVNGPSSGFLAVGEAFDCLRGGRAGRAVCGAGEGDAPADLLFNLIKRRVASRSRNGSRPFDPSSDGFLCSEAGVAFVIETEAFARGRAARPRVWIRGYVNRYVPRLHTEKPGMVALHYQRVIRSVLDQAEVSPEQIGFVQASASGVPHLDEAEALALAGVFGPRVPVTSVHGAAGNCLSAGGPLSIASALLQLENGLVAPIARSEHLIHNDAINYVTGSSIATSAAWCLVTCLDHVGAACCMVLQKAEEMS
jgi:3-oxoacyl-(acyl-carrier-protein) synthase